jgi:hypothetical protein
MFDKPKPFNVDELRGASYKGKEYLKGFGGYPLVFDPEKKDFVHVAYDKMPTSVRKILYPDSMPQGGKFSGFRSAIKRMKE